jgi:hypothetical protein
MAILATVALLAGLYSWAVVASTFGNPGSIGLNYNCFGTDWMVFYAAGQRADAGAITGLYDGVTFTAQLNAQFHDLLRQSLEFRPFLYPPHLLLLLMPFALMGFHVSYMIFLAGSFAALCGAVSLWIKDRRVLVAAVAVLALSPVASATFVLGQNGFLTTALVVAGFSWRRPRPILAGILFGMLTMKPQLGLMVPVALIAGRDWRVLGSAAVTALLLIGISVAFFGIELWRDWIGIGLHPSAEFADRVYRTNIQWGEGIFATVRSLGVPADGARLAQFLVTLGAAATVYWACRRPIRPDLQLAILLVATPLAAPHVALYDLMGILIAAGILLLNDQEPRPHHLYCAFIIWLALLMPPPAMTPLGLAIPGSVLWLGGLLVVEAGRRRDDESVLREERIL